MHVRLAFAVAAHLEPEILIIDEVLAVGDAEFQKKCLGKMQDVANLGRTVFFVSHNMAAVNGLCSRCILLHQGELRVDATVPETVERYFHSLRQNNNEPLATRVLRKGSGRVRFVNGWIEDKKGNKSPVVCSGNTIRICLQYANRDSVGISNLVFAVAFDSPLVGRVFMCQSNLAPCQITPRSPDGVIVLEIPKLPLMKGVYTTNLYCSAQGISGELLDWIPQAFHLEVEQGDYFGSGVAPTGGVFLVDHFWKPADPQSTSSEQSNTDKH